ncbi:MAG: hypothetical protein ACP5QP_04300 [Brevinematia bacterium]
MKKFFLTLFIIIPLISYGKVEKLLPSEPILLVKFKSFEDFNIKLSNIITIMFPKDYEITKNAISSFFEENLGIDITEITNLNSIGINTKEEFCFGFNLKGQPFVVLPLTTTNLDEKVIKLQNTLYKLNFTTFTFTEKYIIATGKEFEKSKTDIKITNEYNVFIKNELLDSITPFKIPISFSKLYYTIYIDNINSNNISLTLYQTPIVLQKTNISYKIDNISYVFAKDNVSILLNINQKPNDVIENISEIEKTTKLELIQIITNFDRELEIITTNILTNLVGPSTIMIYEYYNPLNNKILFAAPVIDQLNFTRILDTLTRRIALKRDIFKFSIFDRTFYKLPIKENYSIYFGIILNRFILSTDKEILIGYIKNLTSGTKELTENYDAFITTIINTQPTINNTIKVGNDTHPLIKMILPLILQSKKVFLKSYLEKEGIITKINIEY